MLWIEHADHDVLFTLGPVVAMFIGVLLTPIIRKEWLDPIEEFFL